MRIGHSTPSPISSIGPHQICVPGSAQCDSETETYQQRLLCCTFMQRVLLNYPQPILRISVPCRAETMTFQNRQKAIFKSQPSLPSSLLPVSPTIHLSLPQKDTPGSPATRKPHQCQTLLLSRRTSPHATSTAVITPHSSVVVHGKPNPTSLTTTTEKSPSLVYLLTTP